MCLVKSYCNIILLFCTLRWCFMSCYVVVVLCLFMLFCHVKTQKYYHVFYNFVSYLVILLCLCVTNFFLCLVMLISNIISFFLNVIMLFCVLLSRVITLYRCFVCYSSVLCLVLLFCCFVIIQRCFIDYNSMLCFIKLFRKIIKS